MQSLLIPMLIGTLFGTGMAIAQSAIEAPVEKKPRHIAKFDAQFKAADKDNDGALTLAEAESGSMHRIVDKFGRIDANKDGKVTRDEIRTLVRNRISS